MPLKDHFHLPLSEQNPWEGFHSAWANTMVRNLKGNILPRRFRPVPQVHLGPFVETDLATLEEKSSVDLGESLGDGAGGTETSLWSPPRATQTLEIDLPAQDLFEVRVFDDERGMRLVAVVELISPGNKDRPEHRQAFITKCAAYLQDQVNVVLVDIVTTRRSNLHVELLSMIAPSAPPSDGTDLYCVAYRNQKKQRKWHLEFWPFVLTVGATLPTVPLWLAGGLSVPLDLEKTYEETCNVLRID